MDQSLDETKQEDSKKKAVEPASQTRKATPDKSRFRFEMTDKTRIIGTAQWETLDVDLGFGTVAIPVDLIRSVKRKPTKPGSDSDNLFVIELMNRDRYTGRLGKAKVTVRFLGGDVNLPFDQMLSCRSLGKNVSPLSVISDGLVLHYDFEGDSKTVVENRVGTKHHAALGTGISRIDSASQALKFTGKHALLTEYHKELCPQRFTFTIRVKPTKRDGQYIFLGGMSKHDGWLGGFAFVYMNGDKENVHFYMNRYDAYTIKTPLPLNKWTQLTGTFDGKNVVLYANGKRVGSQQVPTGFKINYYANEPFAIGGESADCYWSGEMDDVSLYQRALNAREVKELYESNRK